MLVWEQRHFRILGLFYGMNFISSFFYNSYIISIFVLFLEVFCDGGKVCSTAFLIV